MEIKKMLTRASNLFGIAKDAGAFYQRITKRLSLKTSEVDFASFAPYENPKAHKSHLLEVDLRRAQVIADVQRQSLR
jgi:hypothetical protein